MDYRVVMKWSARAIGDLDIKRVPLVEKTGGGHPNVKVNKSGALHLRVPKMDQVEDKKAFENGPSTPASDNSQMKTRMELKQDWTSTPLKTPSRQPRLSEAFKGFQFLSPIEDDEEDPAEIDHGGDRQRQLKKSAKTGAGATTNKLGNPLLSSTKVDGSLDKDRLTNAPTIYEKRLGAQLSEQEVDLVTNQLLHKYAMVTTTLEEEEETGSN